MIVRAAAVILLFAGMMRGQDPLRTLPNNYHLVFENNLVRVIHVLYRSHEKLPVHNHSDNPTVYVYLTDSGPVRFTHVEEHPFSLLRPPETAGTFRVSPGRLERHEVENVGNIPSEFLRVELKQVPLGFQRNSFRSAKSFDLTRSGAASEFSCPFITIKRIVAAGHMTTEFKEQDSPALLIPFSPSRLSGRNPPERPRTLSRGEVTWIRAHQECGVASVDEKAPGHLLELIFLSER